MQTISIETLNTVTGGASGKAKATWANSVEGRSGSARFRQLQNGVGEIIVNGGRYIVHAGAKGKEFGPLR